MRKERCFDCGILDDKVFQRTDPKVKGDWLCDSCFNYKTKISQHSPEMQKLINEALEAKIANLLNQSHVIKEGDLVKYCTGLESITTLGFVLGQVYTVMQDDGGLFVAVNSNKIYLTNGYFSLDSANRFILHHQEIHAGRTCTQCDIGYHNRCSGGDCDCCGSGK